MAAVASSLGKVEPSDTAFPDFDENLREAFLEETDLFVDSTLREDRSAVELLSANYTFVNERLARHYQIPDVHGNRFRRVTFDNDERRGGLLGHGGLLTVTSYPNRTSPVLRGKWLLDNILGTPPPRPRRTCRRCRTRRGRQGGVDYERLEQHREESGVRRCHAPDGSARLRARELRRDRDLADVGEAGGPIDAAGTLPDGARVQGLKGLRSLLVSRREQFVGAMTEKRTPCTRSAVDSICTIARRALPPRLRAE